MPPALDIDKEQVRMLVLSIGVRPAAAKLGLPVSTVGTWSEEGKWLACTKPQPATMPKPASMVNPNNPNISPANALAQTIQDHERATKTALARAIRAGAEHASTMLGSEVVDKSRQIKDLAGAGAVIHAWSGGDKQAGNTINILSENVIISEV